MYLSHVSESKGFIAKSKLIISFNFKRALQMAKSQTVDGSSSMSKQFFLQLPFPQPKKLAGGDHVKISHKNKTAIVPLESHFKIPLTPVEKPTEKFDSESLITKVGLTF